MENQLPIPPVPAEVDLRGLDYMPIFGNHLFGSDFNAGCNDTEWRAGITLWWAAWNQQPAGSLPDDDMALCRLADLGRDIRLWRKVRPKAMHGFVLCSDGRWYHKFLCKQVMVAWDKRVQERERKRKWRDKRHARNAGGDGDETGTHYGTERGRDADVPSDVNGRDVTGRDVVGMDMLSQKDTPQAERDESRPAAAPPLDFDFETTEPQENPIESIPLVDGTEWPVTRNFATELERAYPAVDVPQTLREIRAWNLANPRNRKTKNGIQRHINQWCNREQNRG